MSRQRSSNGISAHRYFNIHDAEVAAASKLTRVIDDELAECRTSVENLSRAIEKYFGTVDLHRATRGTVVGMHPHDFALQLKGLVPRRACPDDLVHNILKANRYLERVASGYMVSLGHTVEYKFGNSIAFIWVGWTKESGRLKETTVNGNWKKTKEDFR
jgi:hypothetical protein